MSQCCLSGFKWEGKPSGKETTLGNNKAYVAGSNKNVAILIVHDAYGWTRNSARILADHYAKEVDATVYLPDFFGGEELTEEIMSNKDKPFDLPAFIGRNSKEIRWPEISAAAKALKQEHGFKKVGAIGFCYGGWAVFQLGSKDNRLVDAIATNHPSLLTKEEIDAVAVPVQINAPEHDSIFTPDLKEHAITKIPQLGVQFDYQYYPGLSHGFSTRGDQNDPKQKQGVERAKNAVVFWFAQHLHLH